MFILFGIPSYCGFSLAPSLSFFMGGKNNMLTGHICMKLAGSAVRSCNYPSVLSCYSNFFLITVNNIYNMFMHTHIISQRIEKSMRCVSWNTYTYTYKYKQIESHSVLLLLLIAIIKKIIQDAYLLYYYTCEYSLYKY